MYLLLQILRQEVLLKCCYLAAKLHPRSHNLNTFAYKLKAGVFSLEMSVPMLWPKEQ